MTALPKKLPPKVKGWGFRSNKYQFIAIPFKKGFIWGFTRKKPHHQPPRKYLLGSHTRLFQMGKGETMARGKCRPCSTPLPGSAPGLQRSPLPRPPPTLSQPPPPAAGPAAFGSYLRFAELQLLLSLLVLHGLCGEVWGKTERGPGAGRKGRFRLRWDHKLRGPGSKAGPGAPRPGVEPSSALSG